MVLCHLKVDADYLKMYITNSRLISSLKESINDMIREKIKWNHTKQKAGKSRKEKQETNSTSQK